MTRELIITPRARRSWQKIATYIRNKFGDTRATIYAKEIMEHLYVIAENPQRYRVEVIKKSEIRVCVYKKKTIIQFVFSDSEVKIISILDARSNWR